MKFLIASKNEAEKLKDFTSNFLFFEEELFYWQKNRQLKKVLMKSKLYHAINILEVFIAKKVKNFFLLINKEGKKIGFFVDKNNCIDKIVNSPVDIYCIIGELKNLPKEVF